MQSAASVTFPILGALVERAARRVGSKMVAYDDVGRRIGETGSWVRKFLGRHPVRLDADTYLAIKAAYARECERIQAEADLERARFYALGGRIDAMDPVNAGQMDVAAGREVSGCRAPPAMVVSGVAALVDAERQ